MRARPIKRNNPHTTAGIVETAEIARLDAENSRLAHENERVARSAEELAVVKADLVTVKTEVSNVHKHKQNVEGELERVREEMVVTWGQVADLVLQKERLETRVVLADEAIDTVKDRWEKALDVLRVARAEGSELQSLNSHLAEELANVKGEFQTLKAENEERQTLDRHNAQDASNALRYCAALEDTVAVLEKDGSRARADLAVAKERLQMTEEERMQLQSENVRLMGELSSVKEELRLSKTEGLEQLERSEISTKENLSALTVEEIRTTKAENTAVPLALDICSAEGLVAAARGGGLAVRKQISEMEAKLVSERQRNVMLEDEKTHIREGLLQIVEYCKPAGDAVYILWCTLVEEFETLRREHNRLSSSKYDDLKTVTKEKSRLEEENQRLRHKINRLLNLPL